MSFPIISAEEAASHIHDGDTVALSGFTASGTPKCVPRALAARARAIHANGLPFKINLYTGASTNDSVDGELTRAGAVNQRMPYQGMADTRRAANDGSINFYDPHLSHVSQDLRYGFADAIDTAVVEVTEMDGDGGFILGAGIGMTPTMVEMARKVIIEYCPCRYGSFRGFHDLYMPADPPFRREIPIYRPSDRVGDTVLRIDPRKIVGVVESHETDTVKSFTELNDVTRAIGANVASFLAGEIRAGRVPKTFLPIQSGVGNVANAALYGLAENPEIPRFEMFTEVVQDAAMHLIEEGKCSFASTCALALSDAMMHRFMSSLDFYRDKIIMRPGEISNHPEVVRRLGLLAMNTALECDIYGFVNSTHVNGTYMMNGIGGRAISAAMPRIRYSFALRCRRGGGFPPLCPCART